MTRQHRIATALLTTLGIGAMTLAAASPALAAAAPPARGAPLGDILVASAVGTILTILLLWIAMAHRAGRIGWLGRLATFSERVSGLPGWAALPGAVAGASLLTAVFGLYWDVAKHIDTGRDSGPFGTAAHYPILAGLGGVALAGMLAIVLGTDRRTPTSVRLGPDWHAPLGGVLILLCGGFALSGFPLDDLWHTLFGQDVTLWGPTHVLMIAGASLSTVGVWVLLVEGARTRRDAGAGGAGGAGTATTREPLWLRMRTASMAGGFLVGLSTLQGEFDFGVPQFALVYQPILIALAAATGLVAARVRLGRWGALQAVAFYLVLRIVLTILVGPVLGRSTLHFPPYLVEALLIELVAARVGRGRPLTLGVAGGALVGTVGLAAEWGWSHVWMPLPWPTSLLPEAPLLGLAAGVAGGVLGAFVGRALSTGDENPATHAAPRWALPAAAATAIACIAIPMPTTSGRPMSATVALRDVQPPPHRAVAATVRLTPPDAAAGAQWLTITAWQGGGLVVDRLRRTAPGVYRTTKPIPAHGSWKALLRMEDGRALRALPVYLPADPAIPAPAVAAADHFTRPFVSDHELLQREAVGGSAWLQLPAYGLLLAIAAVWLLALGLGLRRLQTAGSEPLAKAPRARPKGVSPRAVGTP
jgi:hypothetical protein